MGVAPHPRAMYSMYVDVGVVIATPQSRVTYVSTICTYIIPLTYQLYGVKPLHPNLTTGELWLRGGISGTMLLICRCGCGYCHSPISSYIHKHHMYVHYPTYQLIWCQTLHPNLTTGELWVAGGMEQCPNM